VHDLALSIWSNIYRRYYVNAIALIDILSEKAKLSSD
jgi:hypothetical protein